jgi:hypothetical protein
MKETER